MKTNRKQKLSIILLVFSVIIGGIFFLHYSNRPKQFNVLLITIDALRPDHLSCYGYRRNTSPNIDTIAKEGIMFTQAIAPSSSTISSIPSIMTSTYPHTHRIWNFGDLLDSSLITLAKILKDNGFYTGMIVAQLFPEFKIGKDFITKIIRLDAQADKVTDWAIYWLTKNQNKRFFLWIHYFDPHGPYDPPFPYSDMYLTDKFYGKGTEVPLLDRQRYGLGGIPGYQAKLNIKDINYYIAQYDGEINFVDSQIGRIIQTLKKLELQDKTIIVLTSDHGESLGEHNYYFDHGGFLYDTLIKVPLIIKYSSIKLPKKIIDKQVSLLDIMPTILDILKIKFNPKNKNEGTSLLPFILQNKGRISRYVLSEYFEGTSFKFAIRKGEWKLIYNKENNYELYNLKSDPQELNNLVSVEKDKFEFLKEKLDAYKQASFNNKISAPTLDEETKEKLRTLGYIQ